MPDLTHITSLQDLKTKYRALAMQHHPDRGGDLPTMQAINAEYDRMNTTQQKITVSFAGEDRWGRAVFKGDNGRYYKTIELNPDEGFPNIPRPEQERLFSSLHTCNGVFEGEPSSPCNLEKFTLTNQESKE